MTDQMQERLGDMQSAARELPERLAAGRERLGAAGVHLADRATDALDDLRESAHDLSRRLAHLERQVERTMRDHPGPWIGAAVLALAVGMAIGAATLRRS